MNNKTAGVPPHRLVTLQTLPDPQEVEASKVRMSPGLKAAATDCIVHGVSHPYTKYVLSQDTLLDPGKLEGMGSGGRELAGRTIGYLESTGSNAAILALAAEEFGRLKSSSYEEKRAANPGMERAATMPTTSDSKVMLSYGDVEVLEDVLRRRETFKQ
ncbi:MAG: hypothetical protein GF416_03945 [Candidatus Altiarchaeales archaeon]|nr:hypothetical protein [Candidatus Altiarchaeales archaeon]MBD3416271.1 hypothetical protein [Candidatus Altiarchaeales archaeon]